MPISNTSERHRRASAAIWAACLIGTASLPAFASAETPADKAGRELSALTPDNVAARLTVKDDPLETDATFTTEPIFKEHSGLLKVVLHDSFLRAFVDKRTGAIDWQVYVTESYFGSWHFYEQVNFPTWTSLQTQPLTIIDRKVEDCALAGSIGCQYTEQVGFSLTDDFIRALAAAYDPNGKLIVWTFKLKSKAGIDYTDGLALAEVAGLVKAVDAYRAAHKLDGPVTRPADGATSSTPPTGPALLGVQFVATAFGAVIGTIAPGGRAAAARITPGTVVTAVDGKPLAGLSLDDMRKALAQPGRHIFGIMGKPDIVVQ